MCIKGLCKSNRNCIGYSMNNIDCLRNLGFMKKEKKLQEKYKAYL